MVRVGRSTPKQLVEVSVELFVDTVVNPLRAALAASAEPGLDVERLARAIQRHAAATPWDHTCSAGPGPTNRCELLIAAEYERNES